jgi:uncharacterized membrane protein YraQ (UPF0718 family)
VTDARQAGQGRWLDLIKESFGKSFWVFVGVAAGTATLCYIVLGPDAFTNVIARDRELLVDLLPRVGAAQILAGFVWVLLPRDRLSEFMQRNRGKRGLILAAAAGAVTPGGPASAFPFLVILAGSGADRGILVTYITGWALLGVQRLIVWDIPFMGIEFSMFRLLISIPLPIIAGMLARRLAFTVPPESSPPSNGINT